MDLPTVIVLGLWGLFAGATLLRLSRRGEAAFDAHFTPEDRRLVGAVALYLLTPAAVLLSQLASLGTLYGLGGRLGAFETWVFWGAVAAAEPLAAPLRAARALVAPGLLTLTALALVWRTARRPTRSSHNFLRLELARILGALALGVHPVASVLARRGDAHALRESLNAIREPYGELALLLYACLGAYAVFRWRRATRLRALATPLHDAARHARARLARDPDDADAARLLGATRLASGHPEAIETIERAAQLAPHDPRIELLHGQAMLRRGEAREASAHLRRAGQLYEAQGGADRSLRFEIELALSAARIALGDAEGAVLTAEAARATKPGDPRGLLVLVDALVALGRREEARSQLERAREAARGRLRREIERRLDALERR